MNISTTVTTRPTLRPLPAGWKWAALSELGPLTDGDWILNEHYEESGIRLLQVGDVGLGQFRDRSSRYVSEQTARSLNCTLLKPDDILISRMPDPLGRACRLPALGYACITAVDVSIWRPDESRADREYLTYYLASGEWLAKAAHMASGATRPRISRKALERLVVPVPPLPEQKRIAASLREQLDAAARMRAAAAQQSDELSRYRIRALYAAFRSESVTTARMVRLSDVCDIQLGKMLSPASKQGHRPRPYLRNANVQWGRLELSDIAEMDFTEAQERKFSLQTGDVMVCEGGEPGRAAVWHNEIDGCLYQKSLHRLRPERDRLDADYLAYWLQFAANSGEFSGSHAKTTIAHLPAIRLASLPIELPPLPRQKQIVRVLSRQMNATRRILAALDQQAKRVEQLREALLRRAFSPADLTDS